MNGELYLVWSIEHHAWWGPDYRGYTLNLEDAGRYTAAEALAIQANANKYEHLDHPNEVAWPLKLVQERMKQWKA